MWSTYFTELSSHVYIISYNVLNAYVLLSLLGISEIFFMLAVDS
jgi:hypothetical protein